MIRRTTTTDGTVKVTFVVPCEQLDAPVSVVGDFNDWDPLATPMRRRSNHTRSVAVEVPAGRRIEFRYLADGGEWLTDEDADGVVRTPIGARNAVLTT